MRISRRVIEKARGAGQVEDLGRGEYEIVEQEEGFIRFVLRGERMQGTWKLIRTKLPARDNWLQRHQKMPGCWNQSKGALQTLPSGQWPFSIDNACGPSYCESNAPPPVSQPTCTSTGASGICWSRPRPGDRPGLHRWIAGDILPRTEGSPGSGSSSPSCGTS